MRTMLQPHAMLVCSLKAALLAALVAATWPDSARAERNPGESTATPVESDLNTQGLELYAAGKYREAAEAFLGAYAVDKDPNTLFNVARCYERLGESAAALQKYESFLSSADIEPEGRARAERAVQAIREQQRTQVASIQAGATAPEAALPAAAPQDPAARAKFRRVVIGWTTTGALAVGAVVSGVLALKSSDELAEARDSYPGDRDDVEAKQTKTTRCAITTDILGVAALAMGAVSLYWTIKSPPAGRELRAAIGPSQLNLSGTF